MKITMEDLKKIHAAVNDYYGLDLTNEQILALIKEDESFLGEYISYGMDTCVRERFGDILAKKLIGRRCPKYGDDKEAAEQFYQKFDLSAKAAGYKVLCDR